MNDVPTSGGGPLSDDVHFELVGESLYYVDRTKEPVTYLIVVRDQIILGYLWSNDADHAAGYVPRPAAGDDAFNAGVAWSQRLKEAKGRGLTPSEALSELAASVGNSQIGWVVSENAPSVATLAALQKLASS